MSFEEQVMSKDKYLSIFSRQMDAIVFLISFKCFSHHTRFLKLGNLRGIFPNFNWGIFSHVTRSDQSHASENINDIFFLHY